MNQPKKTVAAIMAALFPKTHKVISEKLETEDFNSFATEAQEVNERLTAQQEGNQAEQADRKSTETQVADLTAKLTTAQGQVTDLTGRLAAAEADRDKYKGWFDKQKESGKSLPEADESSKDEALADYNAHALAQFKRGRE